MNLLDLGYWIAAGLTAPIWARKARGDWRRRFGQADVLPQPVKPRIMLHAVSVGEVSALRALVPMLTQDAEVVVSVGTDTGIARARELFASTSTPESSRAVVVRYPLDFSSSVKRFLDAVNPTVVGLVELELWPNFVKECGRRSIPVAVINGRLSARSFKGYNRFRRLLSPTFASLHMAAVQDSTYAKRFVAMGVPNERCVVTGSMKWDSAKIEEVVPGAEALALEMGIDRCLPLIVAGSTGPNEEELLHRSCPPGVQLLCAPRKPERFEEAAAALPGCIRRTLTRSTARQQQTGQTQTPQREQPRESQQAQPIQPGSREPGSRFLLDTIGELRMAYSLADVVVVGRSFFTLYGSDPIEPIALGKPVVIGPRVSDFQTIVEAFDEAGGIVRTTPEGLAGVLAELMDMPSRRAELSARGRECIVANQGATRRHADLLLKLTHARHV
jgi:3-deoxy-D-manno-octulosonic-acid transferase